MISVIIPTYNEKLNIGRLIDVLFKELASVDFEIIVVDDQSTDGTIKLMEKKSSKNGRIRFLQNPPPKGLSRSILFGLKQAKGKIIIGMDADFNHDPKIINQLINKLKSEKLDIVIASRFIKGGGMEDKLRFFLTKLFNQFLRLFLAFPSTDNASGYYAIKSNVLRQMPLDQIFIGYGEYHLRLVYLAKKMNLRMGEFPVFYRKRQYGMSKSKLLSMFFSYLKVAFQLRFQP
jgi:dolichol-phosphate mannosyltransferase